VPKLISKLHKSYKNDDGILDMETIPLVDIFKNIDKVFDEIEMESKIDGHLLCETLEINLNQKQ